MTDEGAEPTADQEGEPTVEEQLQAAAAAEEDFEGLSEKLAKAEGSPLVVVRERPKDPGIVVIDVDENGEGSGLYGVDVAQVVRADAIDSGVAVRFEASHTIGITRIVVTNGPRGGTIAVRVTTK